VDLRAVFLVDFLAGALLVVFFAVFLVLFLTVFFAIVLSFSFLGFGYSRRASGVYVIAC
jgi:hypothetical protein